MTDVHVAVVGGGLAGLMAGVELHRRGVEVVVIEATDRPGGVVRSHQSRGYTLEAAAGSLLLPDPALTPILDAAGVEVAPAPPEASRRYVATRGRMREVPASPKALAAGLVSPAGMARALAEVALGKPGPPEGESLEAFLVRHFGREAGRLAATLMAAGVFAGDPAKLSVRAAFPRLAVLERDGSVLRAAVKMMRSRSRGAVRPSTHVPVGTMGGMARRLAASLGERFVAASTVKAIRPDGDAVRIEASTTWRAREVVLAVAPATVADLVPDVAEAARRLLGGWAPVAIVGLGGSPRELHVPDGFGVLTGPDMDLTSLGILFESSYAPHRAPTGHGMVRAIVGGALHRDRVGWEDERLVTAVAAGLARLTGHAAAPSWSMVVRHRSGIPQYTVGHLARLRRLEEHLGGVGRVHLTGWWYHGIGLSHQARRAAAIATAILR